MEVGQRLPIKEYCELIDEHMFLLEDNQVIVVPFAALHGSSILDNKDITGLKLVRNRITEYTVSY